MRLNYKENHKYYIFFVILIVYIMIYFQRVSPAAIATNLMEDFHVNASQLGIISGSYFLFYALIQPVIGYLTDKYGPKKVILVSFSATLLASSLFAFVDNFYTAILARSAIGLSTGGVFIPSLKLLAENFAPAQFTRINGLFIGIGGASGAFLATIPLSYLDLTLGWRNVFFLFSILGTLFVCAIFFLLPDYKVPLIQKVKSTNQNTGYFESVKTLLYSKNFIIIEIIFFISFGVFVSFQGLWATKYLASVMEISPQMANSIIFALPLGYLIGAPSSGLLAEKVFQSKTIPLRISLVMLLISWSAITFYSSSLPGTIILILLTIMGISVGMIPPLIFSLIRDVVPSQAMGLSLGLTSPAIFAGVFAFQLLTGLILEMFKAGNVYTSDSFFVMMLFCLLTLLIVASLSFMLSEDQPETCNLRFKKAYCVLKEWSYRQIVFALKLMHINNENFYHLKSLLHLK